MNGSLRFCDKCLIIKPDRSHHCSVCGTCVLKMDHHCPWVCSARHCTRPLPTPDRCSLISAMHFPPGQQLCKFHKLQVLCAVSGLRTFVLYLRGVHCAQVLYTLLGGKYPRLDRTCSSHFCLTFCNFHATRTRARTHTKCMPWHFGNRSNLLNFSAFFSPVSYAESTWRRCRSVPHIVFVFRCRNVCCESS